jgi:hypothetical protein
MGLTPFDGGQPREKREANIVSCLLRLFNAKVAWNNFSIHLELRELEPSGKQKTGLFFYAAQPAACGSAAVVSIPPQAEAP